MKKRLFSLFLLVFILSACTLPVWADESDSYDDYSQYYINDQVDYLTEEEEKSLGERAAALEAKYNNPVYIFIIDNFKNYTDEEEIYDFAKQLYVEWGLGVGEDQNGCMLMLSMDDRDWTSVVKGHAANDAFTDYGRTKMEDQFIPYFKQNDWYGGFDCYMDLCEDYLEQAAEGHPIGSSPAEKFMAHPILSICVIFLAPLVIAAAVVLILYAMMQIPVEQKSARGYMVEDSLRMQIATDQYTHTTVVKTKIEKSSSSGGGGGGFSGHSGKF